MNPIISRRADEEEDESENGAERSREAFDAMNSYPVRQLPPELASISTTILIQMVGIEVFIDTIPQVRVLLFIGNGPDTSYDITMSIGIAIESSLGYFVLVFPGSLTSEQEKPRDADQHPNPKIARSWNKLYLSSWPQRQLALRDWRPQCCWGQ
jgi:hypothetical protein